MDYYPPQVRAVPLTNVRRRRMLPALGEVLAGIGDQVEPTQVVAHASLASDLHILPVARQLNIRGSQLKSTLRVSPGDEVEQGDVIAAKRGPFGRSVRSPINGIVIACGSGRVMIEAQSILFELRAYIPGMVSNVMDGWGVVIDTAGAIVEGVWGAGGEGFGVLRRVVNGPDEPLQAQDIDPSSHGMILVGGTGLDAATLTRAQDLQVRGIVTGGLAPELVRIAEQSPIPIIATEGIGLAPMSTPAFSLLATHDGREASISAVVNSRWGVRRPEIVIVLPAEEVPPEVVDTEVPLRIGTQVRLIRAPYRGLVGTVTALPAHARPIECGARVRGAEVNVGQGTSVFVPLANLEIVR